MRKRAFILEAELKVELKYNADTVNSTQPSAVKYSLHLLSHDIKNRKTFK